MISRVFATNADVAFDVTESDDLRELDKGADGFSDETAMSPPGKSTGSVMDGSVVDGTVVYVLAVDGTVVDVFVVDRTVVGGPFVVVSVIDGSGVEGSDSDGSC